MVAIARYQAIDAVRQRPRETSLEAAGGCDEWADPQPDPFDHLLQSTTARALADCLAAVDERSRTCILLAFRFGYSHAELADRLGMPLGTVKSRIRRGLMRLRRCLER